jgi:predicted GNAT superfamily acetyltransferase
VEVRELSTLEDIAAAKEVIRSIWGTRAREELPTGLLRAMTGHTNMLLGGFVDGELAGIAFGFWGRDDDGTIWLSSSMLGVAAPHRDSGLGEMLERERAAWASTRGVSDIRCDPAPKQTVT